MAARTRRAGAHLRARRRADVRLGRVELDDLGRPRSTCPRRRAPSRVALPLLGEHHATNAAAAATAAIALGPAASSRWPRRSRGIAALSKWRMELLDRPDGARRDQRRLQRQPRLHARRARDAGRDRPAHRRPHGRRPGRDARARRHRRRASTARSAAWSASSASTHLVVVGDGAPGIGDGAQGVGVRHSTWGTCTRRAPALRETVGRQTWCWSRHRAASALERVVEALLDRRREEASQ